MKRTPALALVYLGLFSGLVYAAASVPKFKDYPDTSIYKGPIAPLVLDNELAKMFKTRLREALKTRQPVFAGEYVVSQWGCGTSCVVTAFVNKKTGHVLEQTFGGEYGPYITEYRLNSRLLVAEGPVLDAQNRDTGDYAAYFYLLAKGKLKRIQTVNIERPADANHDGLPDANTEPNNTI